VVVQRIDEIKKILLTYLSGVQDLSWMSIYSLLTFLKLFHS